jgi:hypothetical protein
MLAGRSPEIGTIYRTKETTNGHRYFQLVAIDHANMSSEVVAIFKHDIKAEEKRLETVVESPVGFYIHTRVNQGVKDGSWKKVGKAPVKVELSKLVFKYYRDDLHVHMEKKMAAKYNQPHLAAPFDEAYWHVWTPLDDKFKSINGAEGTEVI